MVGKAKGSTKALEDPLQQNPNIKDLCEMKNWAFGVN